MELTEKEIEDYIFNAAQTVEGQVELLKRGLPLRGKHYRQISLGPYGRLDMLSVYKFERKHSALMPNKERVCFNIIELKKGIIDSDTIKQAARYATGVERLIVPSLNMDERKVAISIILIGSSIRTDDGTTLLANQMHAIQLFTYSYDLNGIKFEEKGGWGYNEPPMQVNVTRSLLRDIVKMSDSYYERFKL